MSQVRFKFEGTVTQFVSWAQLYCKSALIDRLVITGEWPEKFGLPEDGLPSPKISFHFVGSLGSFLEWAKTHMRGEVPFHLAIAGNWAAVSPPSTHVHTSYQITPAVGATNPPAPEDNTHSVVADFNDNFREEGDLPLTNTGLDLIVSVAEDSGGGKTIPRIKQLRALTGCGLLVAKNFIEKHFDQRYSQVISDFLAQFNRTLTPSGWRTVEGHFMRYGHEKAAELLAHTYEIPVFDAGAFIRKWERV